jgi:hypothetical protein
MLTQISGLEERSCAGARTPTHRQGRAVFELLNSGDFIPYDAVTFAETARSATKPLIFLSPIESAGTRSRSAAQPIALARERGHHRNCSSPQQARGNGHGAIDYARPGSPLALATPVRGAP